MFVLVLIKNSWLKKSTDSCCICQKPFLKMKTVIMHLIILVITTKLQIITLVLNLAVDDSHDDCDKDIVHLFHCFVAAILESYLEHTNHFPKTGSIKIKI